MAPAQYLAGRMYSTSPQAEFRGPEDGCGPRNSAWILRFCRVFDPVPLARFEVLLVKGVIGENRAYDDRGMTKGRRRSCILRGRGGRHSATIGPDVAFRFLRKQLCSDAGLCRAAHAVLPDSNQ